jgi:hypothetical protein
LQHDILVVPQCESTLSHGRAKNVARQALETFAILYLDADCCVEVEAIHLGMPSATRWNPCGVRITTDVSQTTPGTPAGGNAAAQRGFGET